MGKVLLLVGVCSAMFAVGVSLKCYSCPDGSTQECLAVQQCSAGEDSCLNLNNKAGTIYSQCIEYRDCDFNKLATMFREPAFNMYCCQNDLCNSAHSAQSMPLIGLLTVVAVLWFSFQGLIY